MHVRADTDCIELFEVLLKHVAPEVEVMVSERHILAAKTVQGKRAGIRAPAAAAEPDLHERRALHGVSPIDDEGVAVRAPFMDGVHEAADAHVCTSARCIVLIEDMPMRIGRKCDMEL